MPSFRSDACVGLSDKEIIQFSLQDIDFFACVVLKYEQRLSSYIQKISQSTEAEAQDILQEAFIKIWKNLNGFDERLSLDSWIFRIAHNETISFWRKKTSFGKDKIVSTDNEKIKYLLSDEEISDFDLEQAENIIEKILPSLKQEYREVLVLKYLEDKSYEEISDILKIPEGTVATRINRAKKAFKSFSHGKIDTSILN
ncbi:MAG: RNA polymerase sigma factor [Saprospiraceae bacterium]